jgi:hypothetical protein
MRTPIATVACALLICSSYSLAADQKPTSFASLPLGAQASIKAALKRDAPIGNFVLTASDQQDYNSFGISVAIDGDTVVVGANWAPYSDTGFGPGAAYVFVKPATGWKNMTQTAKLTASDGQNGDSFGYSVSISNNTILVGAFNASIGGSQSQGGAYVFVEPPGGWTNTTETAKLTASDGGAFAYFGAAAAISGNTVVVGAQYSSGDNPGPGKAYVFVEPVGGWTDMTQTAELTASNGEPYDDFGYAVSLGPDAVVVGGGRCGLCTGTAYVFVEPTSGWVNTTETARLTPSDGPQAAGSFGQSVSLSGNTIAIGDPDHNPEQSGAVYVFVEPNGGWVDMTQTAELTVEKVKVACVGNAVSTNASVIIAGADCTQGHTGIAYVFVEPMNGWHNTSQFALRLSVPFTYQQDYFGGSMSISGTTGIVGAYRAPASKPCRNGTCIAGPGEAFLFTER